MDRRKRGGATRCRGAARRPQPRVRAGPAAGARRAGGAAAAAGTGHAACHTASVLASLQAPEVSVRILPFVLVAALTLPEPAAAQPGFDDHEWRRLDLPHDWSVEGRPQQNAPSGGRGGYFPTGLGWYRKAFRLPAGARGRETWLEFDGVYMNSDVWINGVQLGRRPYGYSGFVYDITKHLVPGVNVVAVRVDNSAQPNSRWYTGSGIYRHVWLTLVDPLHMGHWGTYVTTPRVDSSSAEVVLRTHVA